MAASRSLAISLVDEGALAKERARRGDAGAGRRERGMYIPHAVADSSSTVLAQTWTRAALRVLVSMVYHPLRVAHARGGQRGSCHCSLVASIADPFPRFFASLSLLVPSPNPLSVFDLISYYSTLRRGITYRGSRRIAAEPLGERRRSGWRYPPPSSYPRSPATETPLQARSQHHGHVLQSVQMIRAREVVRRNSSRFAPSQQTRGKRKTRRA